MNQVRKQSLTQVRFHLEYNYAQQLLRKGTISPFFSGYDQTQEPNGRSTFLLKTEMSPFRHKTENYSKQTQNA